MNREIAERNLKIGLFGAALTLIGDLLIGAAKFPDGANMIEGYFAIALAMPAWRPILGGLIGFVGICLEFPGLMTIYPLIREKMPRGSWFYKLAMYNYLAVGGGAVHLPCGVFMWLYKAVAEAAALILIIRVWNGVHSFLPAYLQALLFLEVMNWYDGIVIDRLWVGHSRFWIIPGTEEIPFVQTWAQVLKKRGILTLIWIAGAAIVAGIIVLLF